MPQFFLPNIFNNESFRFRDDNPDIDRMLLTIPPAAANRLIILLVGIADSDECHVVTLLEI